VVKPAELMNEAKNFASKLQSLSKEALYLAKRAINESMYLSFDEALRNEMKFQSECMCKPDFDRAVEAALSKSR
jgi:enoyl-CoA hydratase/carnithine racemase